MSFDQATVFATLIVALVLFIWGRWRYDVVAVMALLVLTLTGIVEADAAFEGFAHPAVVTVACVLIITRGLQNAGVIDAILNVIAPLRGRISLQVAAQTSTTALLSTVMNNIGAIALVMPVALRNAYRDKYAPARSLMGMAFASLLGGMLTLIGTPPNIIISSIREKHFGTPYAMFDYLPVGGAVAVAGLIYLVCLGWRMLPRERLEVPASYSPYDIEHYLLEARVMPGGKAVGLTVGELEARRFGAVRVAGIGGNNREMRMIPGRNDIVNAGDVVLLQGDPEALTGFIDQGGFVLVGTDKLTAEDPKAQVEIAEVIVKPGSILVDQSPVSIRLRRRYGINLLGIARHGRENLTRLGDVLIQTGDVLMFQGSRPNLEAALPELGCLPLAERAIAIGKPRRLILAAGAFALAIGATAFGVLPIHLALLIAVTVLVLGEVIRLDEVYTAIDWRVIVLLGAMIPVGDAVAATGGSEVVAGAILSVASGLSPFWVLALLFVSTMLITDVLNNNATALLMAPIAITLAERLQVNPDAFLMGVAIACSCAFLTPIGHQSATIVMAPGGYRFGDYWRMGLPLAVIVALVALPLLVIVWPL
ncbi:MAG: SLC13 family permease [Acidobacteria bacterium]|nr:SLC13 family permease [Acidobacteriota bacterium]